MSFCIKRCYSDSNSSFALARHNCSLFDSMMNLSPISPEIKMAVQDPQAAFDKLQSHIQNGPKRCIFLIVIVMFAQLSVCCSVST